MATCSSCPLSLKENPLRTDLWFWVITRLIFTSERWPFDTSEPHRGAWHKNRKKKMAKIKIDFFDLFGVGGAGSQCRSVFFFFIQLYPFGKKNFFYRVNFGTFWRSGGKHPFGWWKIKKRWKFRWFSSRPGRSRICSCVHRGPAWYLVRHGFGRNSPWSGVLKNLKYNFACCCACIG